MQWKKVTDFVIRLPHRPGSLAALAARLRGAIIRPLGDVVVLMPPLGIEGDELAELVKITAAAITDAGTEDAPDRLKAEASMPSRGTGAQIRRVA